MLLAVSCNNGWYALARHWLICGSLGDWSNTGGSPFEKERFQPVYSYGRWLVHLE